jgi:4-hydroxyphenylpyruvate dioxygenase
MASLYKPAICTISLGRIFAGHSLEHRLDMAAKYGFRGIELFPEEVVDMATSMPGGDTPSNQLAAAEIIRDLCRARHLEIICYQPLMHYGGLRDREAQARRLEDVHLWLKLAHTLETDLILLPSSFLGPDELSSDLSLLVADLAELADLGRQQTPVIRFAFEALCWGTRVDTWEKSWDVVRRVDRPNFGICFDTFNMAGRIYADPASPSGCTVNSDEALLASLETLVASVDVAKVFLIQLADAERLTAPLDAAHPLYNPEQPARMSWSRNCRLFYGEAQHGAYLPVKPILAAILHGLGFQGWLSFEVFNKKLLDPAKSVPEDMAKRASASFDKMLDDLELRPESQPSSTIGRVQAML